MTSAEFQLLKDSFRGVDFDANLEAEFYKLWEEKTYDRKTWITEAGRRESYFFYVLEGIQAVYFINKKGEKVVIGFSYQGDFSGAYESFLMQEPSALFVEALQPTRMLAINYSNYQKMFDLSADFNKWSRLFLEDILIGRGKREVELINLTARERYINFMRRCPDVLKAVPQKYLASYLNMKPETFSRLRSSVKY